MGQPLMMVRVQAGGGAASYDDKNILYEKVGGIEDLKATVV